MASFTDFKISTGVKNGDRDAEYASYLRALIKELYSVYGIAITKDMLEATDTINSSFDTPIQLTYKNIVQATIDGFSEGTDYELDYVSGTLTILSTGTMLEATDYTLTYSYYLFLNESNTHTYSIFPEAGVLTYHIDVKPYTVLSVTYDGRELVEDVDYYSYNNKFELTSAPTNVRKPIQINMEVGYTDIPEDLKMAFYEMAGIRFDAKDKKTYLISKVQDAEGSTTTYRLDSFPKHIKDILHSYTGRRFGF